MKAKTTLKPKRPTRWHQVAYQGRAFEYQIGCSFIAVKGKIPKRPPEGADMPKPIASFVIARQDPVDHRFLVETELYKRLPRKEDDPFGIEFE